MLALFADAIPQETRDLGTMGSQALLGVAVLALTGTVGILFKVWRSDAKETQTRHDAEKKELKTEHEAEKKELRAEFTSALRDISEAVRAVGGEAKANAAAINQLAAESKANTAVIVSRLDRLERQRPDSH